MILQQLRLDVADLEIEAMDLIPADEAAGKHVVTEITAGGCGGCGGCDGCCGFCFSFCGIGLTSDYSAQSQLGGVSGGRLA